MLFLFGLFGEFIMRHFVTGHLDKYRISLCSSMLFAQTQKGFWFENFKFFYIQYPNRTIFRNCFYHTFLFSIQNMIHTSFYTDFFHISFSGGSIGIETSNSDFREKGPDILFDFFSTETGVAHIQGTAIRTNRNRCR